MKRVLSFLAAFLMVFFCTGSFSEQAEPAMTPGPEDVLVTEADGGEFRPLPLDINEGGAPLAKKTFSAQIALYEDPTIRVEYRRVEGGKEWGVVYYCADITIRDASQIRTAFATRKDQFNPSAKLEAGAIAKKYNAVCAVNGDFFAGFSGNAFVLRQGKVYRDTVETNLDLLLIDEEGDFHVLPADESLTAADKTVIDGKKVVNALQFGPALIIDGEPVSDESLLDRGHSPANADPHLLNQRMAIIQIDKLHYMALTCAHYGMELPRFRDLIMHITDGKAKTAYTLDGGNSSQLIFVNRKRNNVYEEAERRPITDIIYFASAWFKD